MTPDEQHDLSQQCERQARRITELEAVIALHEATIRQLTELLPVEPDAIEAEEA